jgi:hypothetical protein
MNRTHIHKMPCAVSYSFRTTAQILTGLFFVYFSARASSYNSDKSGKLDAQFLL